MSDLTASPAWKALAAHRKRLAKTEMRALFAKEPKRFQRFSLRLGDLLLDYSKNRITPRTLAMLLDLARDADLESWTQRLFAGEPVNNTEGRAALHVALRNRSGRPMEAGGVDVMPQIEAVLEQMRTFTGAVRSGSWKGYAGDRIRDVVSIGIGGSNLGPEMVVTALQPYASPDLRLHFVANVDPAQIAQTLSVLDPGSTLFVITSKTFTTAETLTNARTARSWYVEKGGDPTAVARHFVAISTNERAVADFGIDPANMFAMWDWVGGRYSLWSAVGLPIALAVGFDRFLELLEGAHRMDEHFRTAASGENMPVLMALLGIWYNNFWGAESYAILPYGQTLERLPAFLQQADMESNGKGVTRDGEPVDYATAPVIWGEPGTNSQHAFFQAMHQGPRLIPADFLAALEPNYDMAAQHLTLLANFLAQTEALMAGRTAEEVRAELSAAGVSAEETERLVPHKVCPGNRPTNTLLYRKLDPQTLGMLIALYEHKIFVQAVIWRINPFDQYGVELGKKLADRILTELACDEPLAEHDSSTSGLVALVRGVHCPKS